MNGRNFEYFGEDPYLAGQMAVPYIRGVQSQGVIATVKHFDANNSEYDRADINSHIDERTLREIYLPAFEAAVKQGGVGAVMDAYNQVNGQYMTQNKEMNLTILKGEWGFRGILMSDWEATHDGVAAANGGLDLEMPSGKYMNAESLIPEVHSGLVPLSVIDDKVRRLLRTSMQFGFFDRDQTILNIPLYNQLSRQLAMRLAEENAVLLKNSGSLLPLDRKKIRSIAVIGPNAYPAVTGGGGSSQVSAISAVSFMAGLSNELAPATKVYWNEGIPSPSEIFSNSTWCSDSTCLSHELTRNEYVESTEIKVFSGKDRHVDHWSSGEVKDLAVTPRRVEWSGYFIPRTSGPYRFVTAGMDEDRYQLLVNNKPILNVKVNEGQGQAPQTALVTLTANQAVAIRFIYWPITDQVLAGLGVIAESELINQESVHLAKIADVAVICVGFNLDNESEGIDRTYDLPYGQERLIQEVVTANPHSIVVLTSGGSVATKNWIGQVPALLETWYAGEQGGTALTKLLFGDINPSGKLPISWEKDLADNPVDKTYYEQPGTKTVDYSEGIFLGYRYYDKSDTKPLFPFGFGLSYTKFTWSNLTVIPGNASSDSPITVSFDVRNAGLLAGAEVAQVYVGDPSATVPRPAKELKGFTRVMLAPGQSSRINISLDRRSLAYWDTRSHGWQVDPGEFVVYVGDSSADLPLHKAFMVR
jgi:beta-glucosidase